MTGGPDRRVERLAPIALGVLLIVAGGAWLLANLLNVDLGRYGWPAFVIVPGVILLAAGLSAPRGIGTALVVVGSVVGATGLLLAVQNATDTWQTWAYAWSLTPVGAVGAGLLLAGRRWQQPGLVRSGIQVGLTGLGLFVAGIVFFEGLIGLSGRPLLQASGVSLSVLLIAIGVAWLVVSLVRRGPGGAANRR